MALKETALSIIIKARDLASDKLAKFRGEVAKADDTAKGTSQAINAYGQAVDELGDKADSASQDLNKLGNQKEPAAQLKRLSTEADALSSSLSSAQQSTERYHRQLSKGQADVSAVAKSHQKANQAVDTLTKGVKKGEKALAREAKELKKAKVAAQSYATGHKKAGGTVKRTFAEMRKASLQAKQQINQQFEENHKSAGLFAKGLVSVKASLVGLVAGVGVLTGFKAALTGVINTGAKFEQLKVQINTLMGSIEAGEKATAWIKNFATKTPATLEGVTQGFVKLKAFGLDPMDGAYQAIVDQTAKLGFTQEKMEGIILAVGQAWTKQKLQGEEALQLIERGVPVWDLLAKATGRTTVELQDMASAGELGRAEIKLLIEEMGKSAEGAAADQMGTWNGMISNMQDMWTNFVQDIADAGVFEYMKGQLKALLDSAKALAADGTLQAWAASLSDALVGTFEALKATAKYIYSLKDAIQVLAGGLLAARFTTFIAPIVSIGTAAITSAKGAGVLSTAVTLLGNAAAVSATKFKALSLAMRGGFIGAALTAIVLAIKSYVDAWNEADLAADKQREKINKLSLEYGKVAKDYAKYAGVHIKSTQEMAREDEAQLESYRQRLEGAKKYWEAVVQQQSLMAGSSEEAAAALASSKARLQEITTALAGYEEGLKAANARTEELAQTEMARILDEAKTSLAGLSDEELKHQTALAQVTESIKKKTEAMLAMRRGSDEYQLASLQLQQLLQKKKALLEGTTKAVNGYVAALTGLNRQDLASSLSELERSVKDLNKEWQSGEITLRHYTKQKHLLEEAIRTAKDALGDEARSFEDVSRKADSAKKSVRDLGAAYRDAGKNSASLQHSQGEIQTALVESGITMDGLQAKLGELDRRFKLGLETEASYAEKKQTIKAEMDKLQETVEGLTDSLDSLNNAENENQQSTETSSRKYTLYKQQLNHTGSSLDELSERSVVLRRHMQRAAHAIDPLWRRVFSVTAELARQELAVIEDEKAFRRYEEALGDSTLSMADLEQMSRWANSSTRALDQSRLDSLISSIEQAKQEMVDLRDEAEDTARSVEERLARALGDHNKAIKLQFKEELDELNQKLKEARSRGDSGSASNYRDAIENTKRLRDIELKKAKEREQQEASQNRRNSDRSDDRSQQSKPTRTVRLELDDGVSGDFDDDAAAQSFVNQVKRHRWRSG